MPTPFTHLRLVNPLVQNPERWFDPVVAEALIFNEERMDSEVFVHAPRTAVEQAYLDGFEGSVQIIQQYLALRPGQ